MSVDDLHLTPGNWLMVDCSKMPSESNCQLVILAPEDQKEDLIDVEVIHAVDKHGHQNGDEVRQGVTAMVEAVTI